MHECQPIILPNDSLYKAEYNFTKTISLPASLSVIEAEWHIYASVN